MNKRSSRRNVETLPSISKSLEISNDEVSEKENKRAKRRKQRAAKQELQLKTIPAFKQDSELIQNIEHLKDDIITITSITPQKCSVEDIQINKYPNGVYLEVPGGFKEIRKSELEEIKDVCEPYIHQNKNRMKSDLSIFIQRFSHRITSLGHGLLAGISLWECLNVYFLRPPFFSHSDFSLHFSPIATVSQIFFFTLLVVCLIDGLDRGDLIRMKSTIIRHFFVIGSSSVVTILYSIALILTLYVSDIETKYSENQTPNVTNATEWEVTIHDHNTWWNIIVTRCVILFTSWAILNLWPSESRLLLHLEDIKELEMIKDDIHASMALT